MLTLIANKLYAISNWWYTKRHPILTADNTREISIRIRDKYRRYNALQHRGFYKRFRKEILAKLPASCGSFRIELEGVEMYQPHATRIATKLRSKGFTVKLLLYKKYHISELPTPTEEDTNAIFEALEISW